MGFNSGFKGLNVLLRWDFEFGIAVSLAP
jgi:hypothetical protein